MTVADLSRIDRTIEIKAPPERVWRALTSAAELSAWFQVTIEGEIAPGNQVWMTSVHAQHSGQRFLVQFVEMTAPRRFVWRWHPGEVDASLDYSREPPTTVTFTLEPSQGRNATERRRDRVRRDLAGAAREGLCRQQPGLDGGAWLAATVCRSGELNSGLRKPRYCSRHSEMRHGSPCCGAYPRAGRLRSRCSLKPSVSRGRRSRSTCSSSRPPDIIDGKRAGREHVWALNPSRLAEAQRCLEVIARRWDDALGRLKAHLEEG